MYHYKMLKLEKIHDNKCCHSWHDKPSSNHLYLDEYKQSSSLKKQESNCMELMKTKYDFQQKELKRFRQFHKLIGHDNILDSYSSRNDDGTYSIEILIICKWCTNEHSILGILTQMIEKSTDMEREPLEKQLTDEEMTLIADKIQGTLSKNFKISVADAVNEIITQKKKGKTEESKDTISTTKVWSDNTYKQLRVYGNKFTQIFFQSVITYSYWV